MERLSYKYVYERHILDMSMSRIDISTRETLRRYTSSETLYLLSEVRLYTRDMTHFDVSCDSSVLSFLTCDAIVDVYAALQHTAAHCNAL